jgi:HAD superfamily hydrolase (TIGR01509 family)
VSDPLRVRYEAILFDFDGVLIESEYAGNLHLAEYLTALGHPITPNESMARFMGLAGGDFIDAVTAFTGRALPADFQAVRAEIETQAIADGLDEVAGAVAFVRALPVDLPIAVVSSSSTRWLNAHLAHLGLADRFGDHVFSGREHVTRGKPAPDLYLFAAKALGVDIARVAIIEDSVIGVTGAVASGAHVVGLCAGRHCDADHADRLRAMGVTAIAASFAEVEAAISGS